MSEEISVEYYKMMDGEVERVSGPEEVDHLKELDGYDLPVHRTIWDKNYSENIDNLLSVNKYFKSVYDYCREEVKSFHSVSEDYYVDGNGSINLNFKIEETEYSFNLNDKKVEYTDDLCMSYDLLTLRVFEDGKCDCVLQNCLNSEGVVSDVAQTIGEINHEKMEDLMFTMKLDQVSEISDVVDFIVGVLSKLYTDDNISLDISDVNVSIDDKLYSKVIAK